MRLPDWKAKQLAWQFWLLGRALIRLLADEYPATHCSSRLPNRHGYAKLSCGIFQDGRRSPSSCQYVLQNKLKQQTLVRARRKIPSGPQSGNICTVNGATEFHFTTARHDTTAMASGDQTQHIASSAELNSILSSTTYVAVDFYADWCPPCKQIAPVYQSLAAKHSVPGVLAFAKVNVDHVQDVAARYGVTAMPTFMFFKEGKQVAVNGQAMIRGADPRSLGAAAEKLGALARKRVAERAS